MHGEARYQRQSTSNKTARGGTKHGFEMHDYALELLKPSSIGALLKLMIALGATRSFIEWEFCPPDEVI